MAKGLSPRVRGNLEPPLATGGGYRSIPACAGEPFGYCTEAGAQWVYPRVCGGTLMYPAAGDIDKGLSPRVRGNLIVNFTVAR